MPRALIDKGGQPALVMPRALSTKGQQPALAVPRALRTKGQQPGILIQFSKLLNFVYIITLLNKVYKLGHISLAFTLNTQCSLEF